MLYMTIKTLENIEGLKNFFFFFILYIYFSIVIYFIAIIGASFTTLYSIKILYLAFISNPNGLLIDYKNAHEGDIFMSFPLIILAIFSIFFGYISGDVFVGLGTDLFSDNSVFIHPIHEIVIETEFATPTLYKMLPLIITISIFILYIFYNERQSKMHNINRKELLLKNGSLSYTVTYIGLKNIYSYFNQRLFIELFYNKFVSGLILNLGSQTTKVIDKGSIEYIGPYGLEIGLLYISNKLSKLDTGIITSYALFILSGLITYLFL